MCVCVCVCVCVLQNYFRKKLFQIISVHLLSKIRLGDNKHRKIIRVVGEYIQ